MGRLYGELSWSVTFDASIRDYKYSSSAFSASGSDAEYRSDSVMKHRQASTSGEAEHRVSITGAVFKAVCQAVKINHARSVDRCSPDGARAVPCEMRPALKHLQCKLASRNCLVRQALYTSRGIICCHEWPDPPIWGEGCLTQDWRSMSRIDSTCLSREPLGSCCRG